MTRQDRLQTFVSLSVGNWWQRDNEAKDRPAGLDPARQAIFISVALDALLASHPDASLRDRTHEAYRRRLERLGLPVNASMGGHSHEA